MISKRKALKFLSEDEQAFFDLIEEVHPYQPISESALLTEFPEAKETVIELISQTSKEIQALLDKADKPFEESLQRIKKELPEDKWELAIILSKFVHIEMPMHLYYDKPSIENLKLDQTLQDRLERLNKIVRLHFLRQDMAGSPDQVNEETIRLAKNITLADIGVTPNHAGFVKCPFHNEKTGSCRITKNKFYCFGCGAKGDTIDWIQKTEDKSFKDAVVMLSKMVK